MAKNRSSVLDGHESGGYVVINVSSGFGLFNLAACETADGESAFERLEDARLACRDLRRQSGNRDIYVYALAGVQ